MAEPASGSSKTASSAGTISTCRKRNCCSCTHRRPKWSRASNSLLREPDCSRGTANFPLSLLIQHGATSNHPLVSRASFCRWRYITNSLAARLSGLGTLRCALKCLHKSIANRGNGQTPLSSSAHPWDAPRASLAPTENVISLNSG